MSSSLEKLEEKRKALVNELERIELGLEAARIQEHLDGGCKIVLDDDGFSVVQTETVEYTVGDETIGGPTSKIVLGIEDEKAIALFLMGVKAAIEANQGQSLRDVAVKIAVEAGADPKDFEEPPGKPGLYHNFDPLTSACVRCGAVATKNTLKAGCPGA